SLPAQQGDTVSIVAIDEAGNRSSAAVVTVLNLPSPSARLIYPLMPAGQFDFIQPGVLSAFSRNGCYAPGRPTWTGFCSSALSARKWIVDLNRIFAMQSPQALGTKPAFRLDQRLRQEVFKNKN